MKHFERAANGSLVALIDAEEALLLQSLAAQVADLVRASSTIKADPAIARLLPDAYPDDAGASAEFRRFTASGLSERKVVNAETIIRTLDDVGSTGTVSLGDQDAQAWLRSLTDIRLTIAARLGIETEEEDAGTDIDPMMRDIYDWLGFVQNSLIEALSAPGSDG